MELREQFKKEKCSNCTLAMSPICFNYYSEKTCYECFLESQLKQANENKWISVKDRLPEDEDSYFKKYPVIIRTRGGILPEGYYESVEFASYMPARGKGENEWDKGNTGYWEFNGNEQNMPFDVIYWMMPLPEPPKQLKEN